MKRLVVFALGLYAVIAFSVVIGGIQAADPRPGPVAAAAPSPTPYFKGPMSSPFPSGSLPPHTCGARCPSPIPTQPQALPDTDTVASCSQASYTIWENTNYNGDGLHVCYNVDFPDLSKVLHVQAGICYAPIKLRDDWEDCINSAHNYSGSENHSTCFYTGRNYTGSMFRLFWTGQYSWAVGSTFGDTISSIKWC